MKLLQNRRLWTAVLVLTIAAFTLRHAGAEHFSIVLRVQSEEGQGQAFMDTTPPIGGVNPRPVVRAKAGETIRIAWTMKSGYPHGTMKDVTVHFFVVKEDQVGQKPVPDPAGPAGIVDNSLVMDFAPNGVASGALRFKVTDSGNYLIRVQSENTAAEHDHEHFSAVDLQVL